MKIVSIILFSCLFCLIPLTTFAEDTGDVGYNIQAIIPENQVDKQQSFFDLRMKPNQKQTIYFMINNTSNQDSKYKLDINQAYTNTQGFIDYSEAKLAKKNHYPYDINEIADILKEVKVPKNSSQKIPINLSMPEKQFDGQIASAIQVTKVIDDQQGGISNSYSYILGLKLTETDNLVKRKLNLKKVKPAETFGKTSVVAVLENPTMDAYGHLKYDAIVKDNVGKEIKKVTYDNNMQMAPNSKYNFAIDWNNEKLKPGSYTLHLKVADAKKNQWVFDQNFKISEQEANRINETTIEVNKQHDMPFWIFILVGILLGIIMLGIIWLIVSKRKSKNK